VLTLFFVLFEMGEGSGILVVGGGGIIAAAAAAAAASSNIQMI